MNYKHPYNQRMEIENLMDEARAEVKRLKGKRFFWTFVIAYPAAKSIMFFPSFAKEITANPEILLDLNMIRSNDNTFYFVGYFFIFIVVAIIAILRIRSINKTIKQLNELF